MVLEKIQQFIKDARRVLTISRKPTMEEFKTMAKVTGLGIIVVGAIGFVISLIWGLFS